MGQQKCEKMAKEFTIEDNLSKLESVVSRSGIFLVILSGVLTGIYLTARSFAEESNGLDVGVVLFITALFAAFVVITITE